MNILQNGLALNKASILSTAFENIKNFANISVILIHVIPNGKTDASSVIISSNEIISVDMYDDVADVSAFGLGTNRECTLGQLSTICTNIAKLSTPPDRKSVTGSSC